MYDAENVGFKFSRLRRHLNFYVKRTVYGQDFGAKFNLTYHNGAPVADILKANYPLDDECFILDYYGSNK